MPSTRAAPRHHEVGEAMDAFSQVDAEDTDKEQVEDDDGQDHDVSFSAISGS